MKVILLRPKIGFGFGGAETHAATVAVKLLEKGYEVGVIANKVSFPEEIAKNLKIFPVKVKGFGSVLKHLVFIWQAKKILSNLRNYKLISFFRYPYTSDLLILCDPLFKFLIKQKQPLFSDFQIRYKILLHLEKKSLEKARKIISTFKLGKTLMEKLYPELSYKTTVCYRGIDLERFNPKVKEKKDFLRKKMGLKEGDYVILFVGYDVKRKGLDLLLKVLAELPKKVKLLVVGRKGSSTDQIIYLGKVKHVENYYSVADLFVLPTLYDPGAMSTLEALATGTPVITTSFDGTSEFIKEGENGFIVERNLFSLKQAILKAMERDFDPYRVAQTVKHLSWDSYVECLVSQLEKI